MNTSCDRRSFVGRFALGSVASIFAGKFASSPALATLLPGPAGILKVKISAHPALQSEGGSIQFNFSGMSAHPLMINRGAGDVFYAMDSDCQHNHCVVPTYSAELGDIRCGCHGSRYAIDGALLGGPATRGLNTFPATFDGVDTVSVTVPGLFFSVTQIAVQSATPTLRLRLTSGILPYTTYRVHYQPTLSDTPQIIPFATSPGGPADQTSAFTTSTPITVYVDALAGGTRGFYSIVLVASPF